MASDFTGVFLGRTLIQKRGTIGGARNVFAKIQGLKNELVYFPIGGKVMNPFKGQAKIFAGDLMEYRPTENGRKPVIYLLKTYKVKSSSGTTLKIYRDGYKHVPFVGDILMKAPDEVGGTGTIAQPIQAVKATNDGTDDVWELTMKAEITGLSEGNILVEAEEEQASTGAKMLVKRINAVAPNDYDFYYDPAATDSDDDFDNARYFLTPVIGGIMMIDQMSPMPDCVLKVNQSLVDGFFKIQAL